MRGRGREREDSWGKGHVCACDRETERDRRVIWKRER